MVRRDSVTGWTPSEWAEARMWVSCTALLLLFMAFLRAIRFLDYFRLIFFLSPFWMVVIVGPACKDRNPCKLGMYSVGMFLACWSAIHCYPSQCRHAWGTTMVSDMGFWGKRTAEIEAILREKNSYYTMETVSKGERHFYWPNPHPPSGQRKNVSADAEATNIDELLSVIWKTKGDVSTDGATEDFPLNEADNLAVEKWVESWAGDMSISRLMLRAYCNAHQDDTDMPHVFPLRVFGIDRNQANWTMPCPFWSCTMTEDRPKGKLVFFVGFAAMAALNYLHYRFDCHSCENFSWFLGAGVPRLWWWWVWAGFLPLVAVMLIKTTCDKELQEVIVDSFFALFQPLWDYCTNTFPDESGRATVDTNQHKLEVLVVIAATAALWVYRMKVRDALGLDRDFGFLNFLVKRHDVPQEVRHTFQVCVWRVDPCAHAAAATAASPMASSAASPRSRRGSEDEVGEAAGGPGGGGGDSGVRSLMVWGSPSGDQSPKRSGSWGLGGALGALYAPMFRRRQNAAVLSTQDGRTPSLSVRFYHGLEEVQGTRTVRPTQAEWWCHDPVYFQENFKISVEWEAHANLRCEVRDTSAALGSMSLGSVSFDEHALQRMFEASRSASPQARRHSVPIMQVVQMSAQPPSTRNQEEQQVGQLQQLGFQQHRLSDGGAVWLAFYEHEEDLAGVALCC